MSRFLCLVMVGAGLPLVGGEYHGSVKFGGLPLPGASVKATLGDKQFAAVTDQQGAYSFPDLPDGTWTIEVEMLCFEPVTREVSVGSASPPSEWELKLLPMEEIRKAAAPAAAPALTINPTDSGKPLPRGARTETRNPQSGFQRADLKASGPTPPAPAQNEPAPEGAAEINQRAADGFLINGSSNNGASSPFSLAPAFGNNRRNVRSLYTGSLGLIFDNSEFDARSFSLTGQDTPKPSYNHLQGVATLGGPLKIPHLIRNGPNFFVGYQWTRNRNATTQSSLMPTAAQRAGDFSASPATILDPIAGVPFAGNLIPLTRISPQARDLLSLYPMPNFTGTGSYNFQVPIVSATHQDSLQSRFNQSIGRKNQIFGTFAFQSSRADNPNALGFGFLDTASSLGLNSAINWRHVFAPRFFGNFGYQFSRLATHNSPFFENRVNVAAQAGITGTDQTPMFWGPPALSFASGIAPLSDVQYSFNRNQTSAVSVAMLWNHNGHNVSFGGDFKRQEFNYLWQQDPRGAFTFTGAASGSDFADFLLGVPDTSSIAFGNADKYFRASNYDAYFTDDWRINPELTLNAGMRWEYGAPITEKYGRLVNLDIAPGFTAASPVVANMNQNYPSSLIRPDKHGFEPRVGLAWRPISGSSMIVRAGYGVYYNTSVFQSIAIQMAQQSPLSTNLRVSNPAPYPLTLADGFGGTSQNTFGVDPDFRVGYAQNWQISVQRDLPGSLVMTATYLGIKGTRGMQEFLPNTYPAGIANPCPLCPAGFTYLVSNGNSTREAGQLQLRRRLHNGITASVDYTFSKAIDDSTLGGKNQGVNVIAQNWLALNEERGLSTFDQKHLLNVQMQYTSGMGIGGGTLVNGWRGALLKEWTVQSQITAGSGLPLTPVYLTAVSGTGVTGSIRPDYTGAALYAAPPGLSLNPSAYAAPAAGQWGTAGRDSIIGPSQFTLNASLGRTFRASDRLNLDVRIDATNALNHVTFPSWNATLGSPLFGLPTSANAMRSVQTTLRLRF
jgi:hypothetical protein